MRREASTSPDKGHIQVSKLKVGNSSKRKTREWGKSFTRYVVAQQDTNLQKPRQVGLHRRQARQLSDSKKRGEGCKVCYETPRLCHSWNRCKDVAEKPLDEEWSIIRASSKVDAGRKYFRGLRRSSSRYGSKELAEIRKVSTVLTIQEEDASIEEPGKVGASGYIWIGPGFSDIGPVDEQEPEWFTQAHENEATLAVGKYQSWEDFLNNEIDEKPEDLLDSDGC